MDTPDDTSSFSSLVPFVAPPFPPGRGVRVECLRVPSVFFIAGPECLITFDLFQS